MLNDFSAILSGGATSADVGGCSCYRRMGLAGTGAGEETGGGLLASAFPWLLVVVVVVLLVQDGRGGGPGGL